VTCLRSLRSGATRASLRQRAPRTLAVLQVSRVGAEPAPSASRLRVRHRDQAPDRSEEREAGPSSPSTRRRRGRLHLDLVSPGIARCFVEVNGRSSWSRRRQGRSSSSSSRSPSAYATRGTRRAPPGALDPSRGGVLLDCSAPGSSLATVTAGPLIAADRVSSRRLPRTISGAGARAGGAGIEVLVTGPRGVSSPRAAAGPRRGERRLDLPSLARHRGCARHARPLEERRSSCLVRARRGGDQIEAARSRRLTTSRSPRPGELVCAVPGGIAPRRAAAPRARIDGRRPARRPCRPRVGLDGEGAVLRRSSSPCCGCCVNRVRVMTHRHLLSECGAPNMPTRRLAAHHIAICGQSSAAGSDGGRSSSPTPASPTLQGPDGMKGLALLIA